MGRSTSSIKGRLVLRASLISSALGTCPRQTHNRWQDRGQRFNLRKGQSWCVSDRRIRMLDDATNQGPTIAYAPPTVFGTPTSAMEGLKDVAVPANRQKRERAYSTTFHGYDTATAITITEGQTGMTHYHWLYDNPFMLPWIGFRRHLHIPLRCCMCFELRDGVVWIASFQLLVYSILSIFLTNIVIVGVGIVGAGKRRKNFVFAYRCAVTPIYAIFMAVTVTVFQETCIELNCTNAQLGVITASMGVGFFIQLYWFYVINCLYLRISIENAGHGMPSFVAPRCTDTLGAALLSV